MARSNDLERVYDEHAQALFAFLLHFTRSDADTRDLLQELFVKLARRPELLADVREERGFLLRLARNLAIDHMRRNEARGRKHEESAEMAAIFAPAVEREDGDFQTALARALGTLPPEQRAIVQLKLWEDLTFEEIAEALEISPNTAASRYRYGLDKLREQLRPLYEETK
jgi:RNA polymerase sigma-70 factor (ECF subfamily)